jgi:hypothetical protein
VEWHRRINDELFETHELKADPLVEFWWNTDRFGIVMWPVAATNVAAFKGTRVLFGRWN